ncbi:hypothetical protein UFOVP223_125 [uncultured Caudovirales phage]|uniref:Uncharacterized protein n=1 Tax=uncultured Caudovirales phage TaxID=2100421 RepID=A0A6J7WSM8_9CAUD|nr:hypothetical protein UFOVP110_39 [uncultured Caudovirales phage]CAB5219732.1 hypothetical protein UFOVP223_125 [uncultured Caudovirales phage]
MSPVSGAADLERKNSYWIEFGKREEQERIIKLLEPLFDTAENAETRRLLTMAIALIKGEK